MQDGERFVRWLTFQEVDRPPFCQILEPWDLTIERWKRESGFRKLNLDGLFNFDKGLTLIPVPLGFFPPFDKEIIEDYGEYYIERDERGILMRQRKDLGSMPEWLEHPVKGWGDWEQIKTERLDPYNPNRYKINWESFRGYLKRTGTLAQVGDYPYGLFGTARDLMGTERLLYAFHDQVDLIQDIMDTLTDFWISIYERVAEFIPIMCIHLWEDMAGKQGSLISPQMVKRFMIPNYHRIKEFAVSRSIPLFSVDSDGDVSELVPIMIGAGVNVFWPFEVQAGCDIEVYRKLFPRLGIIGGLDKRALAKDIAAIDYELEKAKRMISKRGYIASLDHMVPPDVSWENYCYFIEGLKKLIFSDCY